MVSDLVLHAVTEAFEAQSTSAAKRDYGLDRYWRNARTIAPHNPRIYLHCSVGDFAVNGALPPLSPSMDKEIAGRPPPSPSRPGQSRLVRAIKV